LLFSIFFIFFDHYFNTNEDFHSEENKKLVGPEGYEGEIHEWFEEVNPATKAEKKGKKALEYINHKMGFS
jgi:hypothetical protein